MNSSDDGTIIQDLNQIKIKQLFVTIEQMYIQLNCVVESVAMPMSNDKVVKNLSTGNPT